MTAPLTPTDDLDIEAAARLHCAKLLQSAAARALPHKSAEALVILAFTYGAAWGLGRPDMLALGDAQMDAMRSAKQ